MFNLTGAAVFCAGLPLYVRLTAALSPKGPELAVIARQLSLIHILGRAADGVETLCVLQNVGIADLCVDAARLVGGIRSASYGDPARKMVPAVYYRRPDLSFARVLDWGRGHRFGIVPVSYTHRKLCQQAVQMQMQSCSLVHSAVEQVEFCVDR